MVHRTDKVLLTLRLKSINVLRPRQSPRPTPSDDIGSKPLVGDEEYQWRRQGGNNGATNLFFHLSRNACATSKGSPQGQRQYSQYGRQKERNVTFSPRRNNRFFQLQPQTGTNHPALGAPLMSGRQPTKEIFQGLVATRSLSFILLFIAIIKDSRFSESFIL